MQDWSNRVQKHDLKNVNTRGVMRLQFKKQGYQQAAVDSIVQCFQEQQFCDGQTYAIDQGAQLTLFNQQGFANAKLNVNRHDILQNIRQVQRANKISPSQELVTSPACDLNLDVEMETGTGKTYCYIKTIFELNKCYGWGKFIVVVPSIAIREGVYKNFKITAEHFQGEYVKKANF